MSYLRRFSAPLLAAWVGLSLGVAITVLFHGTAERAGASLELAPPASPSGLSCSDLRGAGFDGTGKSTSANRE